MRQLSSFLLRLLAALLVIGVVLSVWLHDSLHPDFIFKFKSFESLPSSHTTLSNVLFPVFDGPGVKPLIYENSKKLNALVSCLEQGTCAQNQTKVVILGSPNFRDVLKGATSGEAIWARSTTLALANLGYTFIYMPEPSLQPIVQLYKMFPDLVKAILMREEEAVSCYKDTDNCALSKSNPAGIPPWKVFSFSFFPGVHNPLGLKWTLAPEDYTIEGLPKTSYVGYSIEETCRQYRFVPHSEREDQAWVLAKYLHYFAPQFHAAWLTADFDAATAETGITFAMGSYESGHPEVKPELPSTKVNFGRLNQSSFMEHLSQTRVLVGMSNPVISPTPYDALCLGIPFINPITNWDRDNPTNRSRWQTQHNLLRDLSPPYVYNVFKKDTQGFVQAIKDALANPIDSYILPRMTISAVEERLGAILETDWEHEASLLDLKDH